MNSQTEGSRLRLAPLCAVLPRTRLGVGPLAFSSRVDERKTPQLTASPLPDMHSLCLASTGPGFRSRKSLDRWNAVAEKQAQRLEEKGLDGLRGSDKHKGHTTVGRRGA